MYIQGEMEVSLHPFLNSAWSDVTCNFYTLVILPSRKELGEPLTVVELAAFVAGNTQTCNFAFN